MNKLNLFLFILLSFIFLNLHDVREKGYQKEEVRTNVTNSFHKTFFEEKVKEATWRVVTPKEYKGRKVVFIWLIFSSIIDHPLLRLLWCLNTCNTVLIFTLIYRIMMFQTERILHNGEIDCTILIIILITICHRCIGIVFFIITYYFLLPFVICLRLIRKGFASFSISLFKNVFYRELLSILTIVD